MFFSNIKGFYRIYLFFWLKKTVYMHNINWNLDFSPDFGVQNKTIDSLKRFVLILLRYLFLVVYFYKLPSFV